MSRMHRAKSIAAACIAAWALAACGGYENGNTNGSNGSGTPSTGVPGNDAAAPVLTNNVATDGLNWINYRRSQIALSTLTRNNRIDIAAQSHSEYQRINDVVTHDQIRGKQGFTGVRLQDRLEAANYVIQGDNAIGEVISAVSGNPSGFTMAEELITAIYHRFVIFEPVFKEIGAGAASMPNGYRYFTADMAANNGYGPGLPAATVATWPFNGQVQVPRNFFSDQEEPDPVPDLNEVGYPVSVHTSLTRKLTVRSFVMRARGTNGDLPVRLLAQGQDANTSTQSAAAIVPLAPLASNAIYDVTFIGAVDGAAVSRTWSFTTVR